ncbi:MAG: alpha/beta hydrolase [Pseudomonadota bacterium]
MFVITNRQIDKNAKGIAMFGKRPNEQGPNELRLLDVKSDNSVKLLGDQLSTTEVEKLAKRHKLPIDTDAPHYQSLAVACQLFQRARSEKKPILFFVHGYNNDVGDVLKAARELERVYDIIVVPFTWPANGGGPLSGTAAYLSDKEDARVSATALHRVVQKMQHYHELLVTGLRDRLWQASIHNCDNIETAKMRFDAKMRKECQATLSMLCHSMGNYVLKHALMPSSSALRSLAFDNIALVAADVNNPGHANWLADLPARNRLFVVINEDDGALKWSRRKPGEEQLARLGHHLKNLDAPNAYYVDVTNNKGVGSAHSYFRAKYVDDNKTLKRIFAQIFGGADAERALTYRADLNVYHS